MPPCYWDRLLMERKNVLSDRLSGAWKHAVRGKAVSLLNVRSFE